MWAQKCNFNTTWQGENIYHLIESATLKNGHCSDDVINVISLTDLVSENKPLIFDNSNMLLYMGQSVATKLECASALEKVFMFTCYPLLLSHIVFLAITQCHGAVGIEKSWFNQHKTSKQVLIIYITWDKHLQN